eukprot:12903605-Prorocentrum_lima.AAC.1
MGREGSSGLDFIHWRIGLDPESPIVAADIIRGEVTDLDGNVTRPMMGYHEGTFAHVVGIPRAQSTVGRDDMMDIDGDDDDDDD